MLAAFGVGCLSFLFFKPAFIWGICLFLLGVRLFFSRCFKLSVLVFCLLVVFFGRAYFFSQTLKDPLEIKKERLVLIYPDKFKIDGASFQAEALDLQSGKKLLVTTYLRSYREKRLLLKATRATVWQIKGKKAAFETPTNENQFDWRNYYYARKIFNRFKVTSWREVNVPLTPKQRFLIWLHQLRQKFALYLRTLPHPLSEYGETLFLGIHEVDFLATLNALKQSGILYLFSLSGMHVFYLIAFIKTMTKKFLPPKGVALLLLMCLPFYALLGGGTFSLVRAILMNWFLILGECVR